MMKYNLGSHFNTNHTHMRLNHQRKLRQHTKNCSFSFKIINSYGLRSYHRYLRGCDKLVASNRRTVGTGEQHFIFLNLNACIGLFAVNRVLKIFNVLNFVLQERSQCIFGFLFIMAVELQCKHSIQNFSEKKNNNNI